MLVLFASLCLVATIYFELPYTDGLYIWFVLTAGVLLLCTLSFIWGLIMIAVGRLLLRKPLLAWAKINSILVSLVLLLGAFHFWYIFSPEQIERAKAFVALADPALEKYHQQTGLYPDSLDDLHLGMSSPFWLSYQPDNLGGQEWDFPTGHREQYRFTFGGLCYRGNGGWCIGGL